MRIYDILMNFLFLRDGRIGLISGFMFAIFRKWYLMITVPAGLAAYYFISGNKELLLRIEYFISNKLWIIVDAASHCSVRIININDFMDCVDSCFLGMCQ